MTDRGEEVTLQRIQLVQAFVRAFEIADQFCVFYRKRCLPCEPVHMKHVERIDAGIFKRLVDNDEQAWTLLGSNSRP